MSDNSGAPSAVHASRRDNVHELYRVTSTTDVSRAAFALSGKVTRIGVQGQNLEAHFFDFVRETSVSMRSPNR